MGRRRASVIEADEDCGPDSGRTDDVIDHMYRPSDLYFQTEPGTPKARAALDQLLSVWRTSFQHRKESSMLVLSRRQNEVIRIGDDVTVTVVRIGPNTVRLGIEAPSDMNIVREELTALPLKSSVQEEHQIEDRGVSVG